MTLPHIRLSKIKRCFAIRSQAFSCRATTPPQTPPFGPDSLIWINCHSHKQLWQISHRREQKKKWKEKRLFFFILLITGEWQELKWKKKDWSRLRLLKKKIFFEKEKETALFQKDYNKAGRLLKCVCTILISQTFISCALPGRWTHLVSLRDIPYSLFLTSFRPDLTDPVRGGDAADSICWHLHASAVGHHCGSIVISILSTSLHLLIHVVGFTGCIWISSGN